MPIEKKAELSHTTPIDVLIPAIEKDLGTLPFVIDSVRKYVKHPIREIIIVAPRKQRILDLCAKKGCRFVHEDTVLPITKKDIHYQSKSWDRSGWLYQQLLKLNGDKLCSSDYYMVIDADTVLIRPHVFKVGDKTVFYCRNWSQNEYFNTYKKLMGRNRSSRISFVTHYMLFEKSKVKQLKQAIASKHNRSWYSAIMRSMNKSKQFAFSEFETYGNFLYSSSRDKMILKPALNKSFHWSTSQFSHAKLSPLAKKYRSISLHKRKGYSKQSK
ncbi:hypothetical protein GCM10008018_55660 [Paenibacillus marchantiophytorum]|uniref:Glycosyltransferase family 2 protein n=1 Tax=Paenibacillus marchantiophytorum TaxID=1619310 RepID=A0ABQ1F942_9BACL|nr:DUF6492 family protein [Paenibacillus marchantiophytorum]GGA02408.1 hypothetical protein GCM10008018_55660 [Paenibacillus marchantiophytorum]